VIGGGGKFGARGSKSAFGLLAPLTDKDVAKRGRWLALYTKDGELVGGSPSYRRQPISWRRRWFLWGPWRVRNDVNFDVGANVTLTHVGICTAEFGGELLCTSPLIVPEPYGDQGMYTINHLEMDPGSVFNSPPSRTT
jgi:hypothetical protein